MYQVRFRFRHTAADAAGSTVFAMRNPVASNKILAIDRITLNVSFDGTSAASDVGHKLLRFSAANPTGGTSPDRIKKWSGLPASAVTDASIKEGAVLTVTSIVFEGPFHEAICPTTQGSVVTHLLNALNFELAPGEGIAIQNALTAVIGATVSGSIEWSERNRFPT